MKIALFNWADYALIAVMGLSIIISLVRGFVREALSLVSWIAAFWIAFTFYDVLADLLLNDIHSNTVRTAVAFGSLFLITLLLGTLVNYLISKLVDKTGLSGTDRILGVVFGFARGVLLITVLLMLARLTPMPGESWWKSSLLIPQFYPIEIWLHNYLPQSVTEHLVVSY
jgi:membrane protein required for colicin V production